MVVYIKMLDGLVFNQETHYNSCSFSLYECLKITYEFIIIVLFFLIKASNIY